VLHHFLGQGQSHGVMPTAEPVDATPLKDGVAALMRSNHELLPIGKNINQIAKSLNAIHGGFRNTETRKLQVFAQAVREHVEQAARVVSAIRALVTPHKAEGLRQQLSDSRLQAATAGPGLAKSRSVPTT
jgi:hypothetical protein